MKEVRNVKKVNSKYIIYLISIVIILVVIFVSSKNVEANKYYETEKLVVESHQTLWSIAKNICDENKNLNIYTVINHIEKLNDIKDSTIYEGQVLTIYKY